MKKIYIVNDEQQAQDARDLENLKRFFYDCFEHLEKRYPSPNWSSDYDKGVIFETIGKGASK